MVIYEEERGEEKEEIKYNEAVKAPRKWEDTVKKGRWWSYH